MCPDLKADALPLGRRGWRGEERDAAQILKAPALVA